jgi:glycerol dehydrogenase-like iron-containing ADH family enzyme
MLNIKTPVNYINEPDITHRSGLYIKEYGNQAYIIGGNTSLKIVGTEFYDSLAEYGITYKKAILEGYPTLNTIEKYISDAREFGADIIIAIGGGRVHDVSKVVGNSLKIPVIAVPTIAATCASWAAVSIIYDEQGAFETVIPNQYTPKLILADTRIIATAPSRYMNAGIVDTLAKWYELHPNISIAADNITFHITDYGAQLAFDILREYGKKAVNEGKQGVVTDAAVKTIDAIIYLAGFVGSFTQKEFYGGFAHPFYNASTRIPGTRKRLHGEKIAFALIVQLVLENKQNDYIIDAINEFKKYELALTLEDIGIKENAEEEVRKIAFDILNEFSDFRKLGYGNSVEEIVQATFKADELVRKTLSEQIPEAV